jgi:hypothetical protein
MHVTGEPGAGSSRTAPLPANGDKQQVPLQARVRAVPEGKPEYVEHNRSILPSLGQGDEYGTNDLEGTVSPDSAEECARHLFEHWVGRNNGTLKLTPDAILTGYNGYSQVRKAPFNGNLQKKTTLVLPSVHIPIARGMLPGFAAIEMSVMSRLAEQVGKPATKLKLLYCHILNQSSEASNASSFKYHRDDDVVGEDTSAPAPAYTVIVKLTADKSLSQLSQMVVAGAGMPFSYPAAAGSGCWFHSNLWHSSVLPESSDPCLKLVFFYSVVE